MSFVSRATRQIRVDDEVYAAIQRSAEPLKDTPNKVLRRLLLENRDCEPELDRG